MQSVDVLYPQTTQGWLPIENLARLAAKLFGGALVRIGTSKATRLNGFRNKYFPWTVRRGEDRAALLVAKTPADLGQMLEEPELFGRYGQIAVYICDSFRIGEFQKPALLDRFDLVIRMRPHCGDIYEKLVGERAAYEPFGADVLGYGGYTGERDVDVLRLGRQPDIWEDDNASQDHFAKAGLRFHGRMPPIEDHDAHMLALNKLYQNSKFTLAFSNLVGSAEYTHKTFEYATARWTDAAANGTIVAGIHPLGDSTVSEVLWPEAMLTFDRLDRDANTAQLKDAVESWSEEKARYNHLMALKRLDWRWRLKSIADRMGWTPPGLDAELERLKARITEVEALTPPR